MTPVTPVTKFAAVWIVLVVFAGAAFAQTAAGAAPAPAAAAGSGAAAAAGEPAIPPPAAPATPPPAAQAQPAPDARRLCAAAMNADPQFAAEIIKIADEKAAKQRDADTLAAHTDANAHVQKNERTVIYGYAAMWIVAAAFVIFLSRRQQALKTEIANLRRDLEAAADPAVIAKERA